MARQIMRTDTSKIDGILKKLKRKDPVLFQTLSKKIIYLSELELTGIEHLKNLRGDLSHLKRVHVGSFVLTFQVKGDILIFEEFTHHDRAYD